MEHTSHRRINRVEIAVVFILVVAFASTAWAEVTPLRDSVKQAQLSYTEAVALSAISPAANAETQELRIRLVTEKRQGRLEARRKRRRMLAKRQAASASSLSPSYTPSSYSYNGSGRADWDAVAACESGQRWNLNTGNGYWGGLQFAPNTWFAYGGGPYDGSGPFPYSREQQIVVAERVLAAQGPGAWPVCFRWA